MPPGMEQGQYPEGITTKKSQEAYDKQIGEQAADKIVNREGAASFKSKVANAKAAIEGTGDKGFGPIDSSGTRRFAREVMGNPVAADQQNLDAIYAGLELEVAKMELKGQGAVTENERMIARRKLGGLKNMDAATALRVLENIEAEADRILAGQGTGGMPSQDGSVVIDGMTVKPL
jgi:hypothetical protein